MFLCNADGVPASEGTATGVDTFVNGVVSLAPTIIREGEELLDAVACSTSVKGMVSNFDQSQDPTQLEVQTFSLGGDPTRLHHVIVLDASTAGGSLDRVPRDYRYTKVSYTLPPDEGAFPINIDPPEVRLTDGSLATIRNDIEVDVLGTTVEQQQDAERTTRREFFKSSNNPIVRSLGS